MGLFGFGLDSARIRFKFGLDSVWVRFGCALDLGSMIMLKVNTFFALVLGAHLKLVLGLFGFGLDSVSFRFGFVLGSVSIPLGFILDSISIRCIHIVSDVWDSISAIWN